MQRGRRRITSRKWSTVSLSCFIHPLFLCHTEWDNFKKILLSLWVFTAPAYARSLCLCPFQWYIACIVCRWLWYLIQRIYSALLPPLGSLSWSLSWPPGLSLVTSYEIEEVSVLMCKIFFCFSGDVSHSKSQNENHFVSFLRFLIWSLEWSFLSVTSRDGQ